MYERLKFIAWSCVVLVFSMTSAAFADECASGRSNIPEIAAFEKSAHVRSFIESYPGDDVDIGCTSMTGLSSICGAAGCSRTYLLTKQITTRGVNPQTRVVMGLVDKGTVMRREPGETPVMRPVRLAPMDAIVVPLSPTKACPDGPGSETTAAIRKCREQAVADADRALVKLADNVRTLFAATETDDADPAALDAKRLEFFIETQGTWEIYRKLACEAERLETFPGSFAEIRHLECLWRLAEARREQIRLTYFAN